MNKSNIKRILGIIVVAILFYWALQNINTLTAYWTLITRPFWPLVLGLCIAFILNVPMRAIEGIMSGLKFPKLRRGISLTLTIIFVFSIIILVLVIVVPEVVNTVNSLSSKVPGFVVTVQQWINKISADYPELGKWLTAIESDWESIGQNLVNFLQSGITILLNSIFGITTSVINGIYLFIISFLLSIYILLQKEKLGLQTRRFLFAYLPEERVKRILSISSLSNKIFSGFIAGQCTEAMILGLMIFIVLRIFNFPYALVISVLVTFTALIPIFGAYISCIFGALLILITSPIKAFWFVILFIIIQQFEGNVIYPKVVGKSVGLPSLWVLIAVILGGSVLGITGMLISVPLCSVIYALLGELVEKRLAKKDLKGELHEER